MTRTPYPGGWYAAALPTGEFAVLLPALKSIQTHAPGLLPYPRIPDGATDEPLFLDISTASGDFTLAGKGHGSLYSWELVHWGWGTRPTACGNFSVLYDLAGALHISDCSIGVNGWRCAVADGTPTGRLLTGDETYGPWRGLTEWSPITDDLTIGQGWDGGGVQLWDRGTMRVLETGACYAIKRTIVGEKVALAFYRVDGGVLTAVIVQTTVAELRARPPFVTAPVEPPIEPPVIPPVEPPVVVPPKPPIEPTVPTRPLFAHTKGPVMAEIDGKIVQLRGAGGLLIAPDAPNTGTWGSLNKGWRGVRYVGDGDAVARLIAAKLPNGRYTFTNEHTRGLAGADGGQYSPALDKQGYFKPDGDTDAGELEQWRVYDGNDNGAIEAQIEQETDALHPSGAGKKFFVFPLTVEVLA